MLSQTLKLFFYSSDEKEDKLHDVQVSLESIYPWKRHLFVWALAQTNVKSLCTCTYFVSQSASTVKLLLQLCVTPSRKKKQDTQRLTKHFIEATVQDRMHQVDYLFLYGTSVGWLVSPSNAMISHSHKQARDRVTGAPPTRNPMLTGFLMREMM